MNLHRRTRPIVFGASSLALVPAEQLERVEIRPPIRHGDLQHCHGRAGVVLILDGLFGASMAITPTECRELLQRGWIVAGAASMGALRAADLWPAGMIGFGDIYNLFRIGLLRSDADVSVALAPDTFHEVTVSVVHVRALLQQGLGANLVTGAVARKMIRTAREIYWADRAWSVLVDDWKAIGIELDVLQTLSTWYAEPAFHPKAIDGKLALATILGRCWIPRANAAVSHG